jgi:peptide deformylase
MVKEVIKYPTPHSVKYATDVRLFDEELFSLIDDLKDTIKENNLDGLAAFQIGGYYNVIVVKDENGEFLELINPRLISHSGKITTVEKTAYFDEFSAEVTRFDNITVVYQDRNAEDRSLKANGDLAVLIQRKIDYTFGSTFLHKLSKDEREKFEEKLKYGVDVGTADYCPTTFHRDKILKVINIVMIGMVFSFLSSLFIDSASTISTIWKYQLYASYGVLALSLLYFFYAQYEGKKYISCSSCQIGNIIGTTFIVLIKLSVIMLVSYILIKPT